MTTKYADHQTGNSDDSTNLEQLLDQIVSAVDDSEISLGQLLHIVGRRSFGPLLLLAGLITLAPLIGDIPGMPTLVAVFVLIIALQLLAGRAHFWLPEWLLSRKICGESLKKGLSVMHKPARFIDRFLKPRLMVFVNGHSKYIIAVLAAGIALMMPIMEVVPFTANAAGLVLVGLGLALISRDGLLAISSILLAIASYCLVAFLI